MQELQQVLGIRKQVFILNLETTLTLLMANLFLLLEILKPATFSLLFLLVLFQQQPPLLN
jgi:hypothetical protein